MPDTDTNRLDQPPQLLDRLLSLFTGVQRREGLPTLLMALNLFFLLVAYTVLKVAREAFLAEDPNYAHLASYASAFMAVLLIPYVRWYGKLAERLPRKRLIVGVLLFFVSNLLAFYFLSDMGIPSFGLLFFVWIGIFNNSSIAQLWAYGNDLFSLEQGKRLFPVIQIGGNLGAILGPLIAETTLVLTHDPKHTLLIGGAILLFCAALTTAVERLSGQLQPVGGANYQKAETALKPGGGFQLVWKTPYLFYIAVLILVLNLVNTNGEYILRAVIQSSAEETAQPAGVFAGLFYARFHLWVNVLTLTIQSLVVSRALKFAGIYRSLFVLPTVAMVGYVSIGALGAVLPLLTMVRSTKLLENSLDYSLMNTLRAALFLPTSREMKYKSKQAIDTFFVRAGDVLSAGLVFALSQLLQFGVRVFAGFNVAFILIWLILARQITRTRP